MRAGVLLLTALAALGAMPARAAPPPETISTGKRVDLSRHLRKEGTTLFLFVRAGNPAEAAWEAELQKRLPAAPSLALRRVQLDDLEAPVARQHAIVATPVAIVLDRFGRQIARTGDPDEIVNAVGKGLRMGRIRWIDEEDPRAPEVYGRPAEELKRGIPGIVKTMSLRPDAMEMFWMMSRIHFSDGFLDRRTHELIAAYVSALNRCKF